MTESSNGLLRPIRHLLSPLTNSDWDKEWLMEFHAHPSQSSVPPARIVLTIEQAILLREQLGQLIREAGREPRNPLGPGAQPTQPDIQAHRNSNEECGQNELRARRPHLYSIKR